MKMLCIISDKVNSEDPNKVDLTIQTWGENKTVTVTFEDINKYLNGYEMGKMPNKQEKKKEKEG